MKWMALLLLQVLYTVGVFGQDVWHKTTVSSDLTVALPGTVSTKDIQKVMTVYIGLLDSNMYMVIHAPEKDQAGDLAELEKRYAAFIKGMAESQLKAYTYVTSDTSVGGTRGKIVRFTAPSALYNYQRIQYYITIAHNDYYGLVVYYRKPPSDKDSAPLQRFYGSATFRTPVPENSYK